MAGRMVRGALLTGCFSVLVACDQSPVEPDGGETGASVVPTGRGSGLDGVDIPGSLKQSIESHLEGAADGAESLEASLAALSAPELWSVIDWLASAEADEGLRAGMAAVVLSSLVDKEPREVARYLAREGETPFGLSGSSASLLAFREANDRTSLE